MYSEEQYTAARPIQLAAPPKRSHITVQQSVVKVQALFRGYYTRKKIQSLFLDIAPVKVEESMGVSPRMGVRATSEMINPIRLSAALDLSSEETMSPKKADSQTQSDPVPERALNPHALSKPQRVSNLVLSNGTTYTGTLPLPKGDVFEGVRHGYGVLLWPDGSRYEGEWRENKACGKGKFWHADGDVFEGNWREDKANGYGIYTHRSGSRYEGYWENDLQHGTGKETWTKGSWYEGEYARGRKQGYGKHVWEDGSQYEGLWEDNVIHGKVACGKR